MTQPWFFKRLQVNLWSKSGSVRSKVFPCINICLKDRKWRVETKSIVFPDGAEVFRMARMWAKCELQQENLIRLSITSELHERQNQNKQKMSVRRRSRERNRIYNQTSVSFVSHDLRKSSRVGLDDPYGSLPTQHFLGFRVIAGLPQKKDLEEICKESSWKAFCSPTGLSVEESLSLDSLSKYLAQLDRRLLELKKDGDGKYVPRQKKTKLEQELLHLLAIRDTAEAKRDKLKLRFTNICNTSFWCVLSVT